MLDYYDCSPIGQPRFIVLCKGHLECLEDKCLRCRISKDNAKASCYKPVILAREFEGRSTLRMIREDKKKSLEDSNFDEHGYYNA